MTAKAGKPEISVMRGFSGILSEKKRGERAEKRHDDDAVHGGGQAAVVVGHPAL